MSNVHRTVSLHLHPEYQPQDVASFHAAIGYLSCWGKTEAKYRLCSVYGDADGTLQATYQETRDGTVNYSIMGLCREDGTYSFHS